MGGGCVDLIKPHGQTCAVRQTQCGVKLFYSGFETCFGPSTQGAGTKTHLKSRFCAILKKKGARCNLGRTGNRASHASAPKDRHPTYSGSSNTCMCNFLCMRFCDQQSRGAEEITHPELFKHRPTLSHWPSNIFPIYNIFPQPAQAPHAHQGRHRRGYPNRNHRQNQGNALGNRSGQSSVRENNAASDVRPPPPR